MECLCTADEPGLSSAIKIAWLSALTKGQQRKWRLEDESSQSEHANYRDRNHETIV